MGCRQIINRGPYRADLVKFAAVNADMCVEGGIPDGFLLKMMIVAAGHRCIL